jgi:hypothetical protein
MAIEYHYPVEQLDELINDIYERGMTPFMTPDMKAEVELRYQELLHGDEDYDEDDPDADESVQAYMNARRKHEEVMKNMEQQRRKSHSRNVIILDLTEEEQQELHESMQTSYVRSDPNSMYNMSDEDIAGDAERRRIYKQLQSLGKVYYHQEDYRNALNIIMEAIDYSLRNDYPWMTYEEACQEFKAGRIHYNFAQLPILYIDYNTQISDPKLLAGIVSGEINLVDKDAPPVKKKKVKSKPVKMEYTIIGPEEHARLAQAHQAGYNTDISMILKSCSTIYNRYVIPQSFFSQQQKQAELGPPIDWSQPGTGEAYFNAIYGKTTNPTNEIVALLNEQNDRKLNHTIGHRLKEFGESWKPETVTGYKVLSTSLEQNEQAIEIENRLMNQIRMTNPNL